MGALTLFQMEDDLMALLETEPMVSDPEQRQEIEAAIVAAKLQTAEKRDHVSGFISTCNAQEEHCTQEIARLTARRRRFASTRERVEGYVVRGIKDMGVDAKGKFRRLEGNTTTLSLKKCPASVQVTDEAAVPSKYKTLVITVPAEAWDEFTDEVGMDALCKLTVRVLKTEVDVMRDAAKADLKAGVEVPGVALITDKYRLSRD